MVAVCTAKQHCGLIYEQRSMTLPQGLFYIRIFNFIGFVFISLVLYFQINYISSWISIEVQNQLIYLSV